MPSWRMAIDLLGASLAAPSGFWWLLLLLGLFAFLRSSAGKGRLGELYVIVLAYLRLDRQTYRAFHDVTLPTPDGTTQIDHVVVSRFGVFVIETKNMRGWIFGREGDARWTQSIYGHKQRFQNPLRQNFKHVKAVESLLQVPADTIHSVVAFVGDATLKSELPRHVTTGAGFVGYVRSFAVSVFTDEEVERLVEALRGGRLAPTFATHQAHVRQLRQRDDPTAPQRCPKCGSALELHTIPRGEGAGRRFWGCSRFPACRYTRSVEPHADA